MLKLCYLHDPLKIMGISLVSSFWTHQHERTFVDEMTAGRVGEVNLGKELSPVSELAPCLLSFRLRSERDELEA